ncbi:MAG: 50S ribosomal protein L18 [Candidatus Woesearchaeota archaeon]
MNVYTVKYRRKRDGRTNYLKRLKLLESGKKRLVSRRSQKYLVSQIIEYHPDGDKIIAHAHSKELEKFGWRYSKKNIPAAYLTGMLIGMRAKEKGVTDAVFDIGLHSCVHGGRIFAILKGAVDAGLDVSYSQEAFPKDERIKGVHIANYKNPGKNQFTKYRKEGLETTTIVSAFEDAKEKILGMVKNGKEKETRREKRS